MRVMRRHWPDHMLDGDFLAIVTDHEIGGTETSHSIERAHPETSALIVSHRGACVHRGEGKHFTATTRRSAAG